MTDLKYSNYDFTKIPFDKITRFGQRTQLYRDLFCVSYLLNRHCFYKCSYCRSHGRSDIKDFRPTKVYLGTLDEIKRQARERNFNSFHFSLSGGEATTNPSYLNIVNHLSEDISNTNYTSLHTTTNMGQSLKWWGKFIEASKPLHRVSITASFHREFAKLDEFVEKLIYLQNNDVQVTINMVMLPERFDKLWEEAEYLHSKNLNVTLKPQSDPTASYIVEGYTKEMLAKLHNGMPQRDFLTEALKQQGKVSDRPKANYLRGKGAPGENSENWDIPQKFQVELIDEDKNNFYLDQAERMNSFNFNKFKGWECSSGYRSIIIREPDGSVKRSYSCDDKPLGYIETGFKLFDEPKICITNTCVSSADSKIPKRKQGVKLPLWPGDKTFK